MLSQSYIDLHGVLVLCQHSELQMDMFSFALLAPIPCNGTDSSSSISAPWSKLPLHRAARSSVRAWPIAPFPKVTMPLHALAPGSTGAAIVVGTCTIVEGSASSMVRASVAALRVLSFLTTMNHRHLR